MIYRIDFSSTAQSEADAAFLNFSQFTTPELLANPKKRHNFMLSLSNFWEISDREFPSPGNFFQSAEADIVCTAANFLRPVT